MKLRNLANSFIVIAAIFISGFTAQSASAQVAELVFVDMPETVESFVDFSFKLEAQDASEDVVINYTGTVVFTSETDDNAELPGEYTFTLDDQGVKEFTESYFFTEAGEQEFTVTDKDDPDLTTTITVNVTDEPVGEQSDITLTSPTAGDTTNSTITVRGQTTPGVSVTILDGEEILGTVDADAEGNFEFQTSVLPDGQYNIKASTNTSESDIVPVNIVTSAPGIDFFEVIPKAVTTSENIQITVTLVNEAREVKAIINNVQTVLTKDDINPKLFSATFPAPSSPGDYDITLEIEDDLGNIESNVVTGSSIVVAAASADDSPIITTTDTTFTVPSQVLDVTATVSDQRVVLTWSPATAAAGVKNYAIYYGASPNTLPLKVETFDANTTWFIPNLVNGETYYFQVFAIDNNGNRSDQGSQIIGAIPSITGATTLHGSAEGQVIVNQTAETGPGLLGLAAGSLFGAKLLSRRRKRS